MVDKAWVVRGGEGGEWEEYALDNSVAVFGWADELPDLRLCSTENDLDALLVDLHPDWSKQKRGAYRSQLWAFSHRIQHGDSILVPRSDGTTMAVGEVADAEPYRFNADAPAGAKHQLPVEWFAREASRRAIAEDIRGVVDHMAKTVGLIRAKRAATRLWNITDGDMPDGYEEGGVLWGTDFTIPEPFTADSVAVAPTSPGVMAVWGATDPWDRFELLYVGYTSNLRRRLRQHLSGPRDSTILHKRVGEYLDALLEREATNDEIVEALSNAQIGWSETAEPEILAQRVGDELTPRFRGRVAAADRRSAFLGSIGKTTLSNWDLCKQHGVFGIGANSSVAKARAQDVQRGDQILFWLGGRGYAAICTATDHAQPVESGDTVPWPGEYAFTIPIAIDLELQDPVLLKFPDGSQEKTGIPKIAFQAGFWDLDPDQSATIKELMLSGSRRDMIHLLFKWNQDREPRTVLRHKEVADEQGSVWWGKFGARERASLSAKNISKIRDQIASGEQTLAILYRPGEAWRTDLLEITDDPDAVDDDLLPDYYSKDECELFVRVTGFQELTPEWPINNLVLASNPDPSKMPGALGNQRTPLIVNLRSAQAPEAPVEEEELTLEWLVKKTGWKPDRLQELVDTLKHVRPQVVLAGPPGTSKTWVAKHVARYLAQNPTVRTVQFHPSYGYEEFIEGLRPEVDNAGLLSFKVRPGIVRQMVESIDDADQLHVLVVDEMNRANLPRVFGELMYLFEYRDDPINLQYTNDFELPENLLFIGTMNTADRSIRSIDIALRRRFDVFECPPESSILEGYYDGVRTNDVGNLVEGFETLNAALTERLDRHHTIGHTFFMVPHMTRKRLAQVWDRQLKPLIEEYFFDQPDIAAEYTLDRFWPGL